MKFLSKYVIFLLLVLVTLVLTSCLEEEEGLYDKVGAVATIPVFSAANTVADRGDTIKAGDPLKLRVRFYSPNVAVKELILNQTIASGAKQQIASRPVTGFNTNDSYVEEFDYQVPADAANKRIVLEVVAVTENDLANNRTLTLNVR